jgi:hypothetical protein
MKKMKKTLVIIALVGFTFAGMANNEIKKTEKNIDLKETNESIKNFRKTPCADAWSQNVKSFQTIGFNLDESIERADNLFNACLDATYGPIN